MIGKRKLSVCANFGSSPLIQSASLHEQRYDEGSRPAQFRAGAIRKHANVAHLCCTCKEI
jgi:hypothetical protein